jgi:hypothetical protein
MSKKESGKGRKIGRSSRKPSHNRYNLERRWEKNKERKQVKIKKVLERKEKRKNGSNKEISRRNERSKRNISI